MKRSLLAIALVSMLGTAHAEMRPEEAWSFITTLSTAAPTLATIRGTEITLGSLNGQHRGVAAREQIKDDLVQLNDDMVNQEVAELHEVRQPALKELMLEIASNEQDMETINGMVKEGSELQKISTAVALILLRE